MTENMTKQLIKMKKEIANNNKDIDELYHTFWINTLIQFRKSNNKIGVYFWLQKQTCDNYTLFYYDDNGLNEKNIKMNENEKEIIIKRLIDDGFEIAETKNKSILLTIKKEAIINYINSEYHKENEKEHIYKMPITPFAETRRRK